MSHDDHEVEPIPGLPAIPPEGETILWQGNPHWPTVARRILHVDLIAAYLAVMVTWRAYVGRQAGYSIGEIALTLLPLLALAMTALAILTLIAWGISRTTIYTITNRRIALRFGIALPVTFNLPFNAIAAADLRDLGIGRGDIALRLTGGQRLAYLVLWPHARPWRLRLPEPMLRALPDAARVAELLGEAVAADMARQAQPRQLLPSETAVAPKESTQRTSLARPVLVAAE